MDKIDTDELRRIVAEATPGPWTISRGGAHEADEIVSGIWSVAFAENCDSPLIALAPDLAAEVIAARVREAEEQEPVACPCTMIEQDESCPVGYPSLICENCDGRGHIARPAPTPAVPDDVAGLVQRGRTAILYCQAGEESALPELLADALEAQAAELAQLRADRDQGAKDYCDLMGQRDALHVRVKTLEAALRPFVAYVHDDLRKGKATYELVGVDRAGGGLIGAEDLRRALAAFRLKRE